MTVSSSFKVLVLDQLGRAMPRIRARPMFGGVGIYSGEIFFALIADDTLDSIYTVTLSRLLDRDGVRCGVHSNAQNRRGDAQDVLGMRELLSGMFVKGRRAGISELNSCSYEAA